MAKPSGWFQATCIAAIVLGALGLLTGLTSLVSLVTGGQFQRAMASQGTAFGPMPEKQLEMQQAMADEIEEATAPWRGVLWVLLAVHFLAAAGLLAGGIGTLRLSSAGRALLLGALALAILLEAGRLVPNMVIQWKTMQVSNRLMTEVARTTPSGGQPLPPEARMQIEAATGAAVGVVMVLGIVMGVAIVLLKVGFYVFGLVYLRRPTVRVLFEPPTNAELAPGPP